MMNPFPLIADLEVSCPFRVYDLNHGEYIFSNLDLKTGDIPPDVACLPVYGLRAVDNVLYIDTRIS